MRKLKDFIVCKSAFLVYVSYIFNCYPTGTLWFIAFNSSLINYLALFPGYGAFYMYLAETLNRFNLPIFLMFEIIGVIYYALCFVCSKRNLYSYVPILIEIFILATDIGLWVAFSAQVSLIKIHGYQCLVECAVIAIQIYRITVMSKQRKEAMGICEPLDVTKFDDTK